MKYSEFEYCELVTGGLGKAPRDRVVKLSEINGIIDKSNRFECYRSHFRFTEEFHKYVNIEAPKKYDKRTVEGYDGDLYSDFIWLDIDSDEKELEKSLQKAQDILNRLMLIFELNIDELIRCYFSGEKGFHIGVPTELFGLVPSGKFNLQSKELARELSGDTITDISLYDKVRLFRLSNTKHRGEGLYKIELTPDEILLCKNVNDIKWLAKEMRLDIDRKIYPDEYFGKLADMVKLVSRPEPTEETRILSDEDKWVSKLISGGLGVGERTPSLTRLIGYLKSKGIPQDIALEIFLAWDLNNTPPLQSDPKYPKDKIIKTVADIYKYKDLQKRDYEFMTWEHAHKVAADYIKDMDKRRIKFGYPKIDKNSGGLGPGEVAYIQAFTGVGKTALAQSIQLNLIEQQGIGSLMISLEMSPMRLYFRMLSMLNIISPFEVEDAYRKNDAEYLVNKLKTKPYNKIFCVDSGPVPVDEIVRIYEQCPEQIGLVIIDYIGLVQEKGDPYVKMSKVSNDIVKFAKEKDVAVLGLVQYSRQGMNGEVRLGFARDSGIIDADARIILGLAKEEEEKQFRKLYLLKASHGYNVGEYEDLMFLQTSARLVPTVR